MYQHKNAIQNFLPKWIIDDKPCKYVNKSKTQNRKTFSIIKISSNGLHIVQGISSSETLTRTGIETQPGPSGGTLEQLSYKPKHRSEKATNTSTQLALAILFVMLAYGGE